MTNMKNLGRAGVIALGCSQTLACTELRPPTDAERETISQSIDLLERSAPMEIALAHQAQNAADNLPSIIEKSNTLLKDALKNDRFVVFDLAEGVHADDGGFIQDNQIAISSELIARGPEMLVDILRHESTHAESVEYTHKEEVMTAAEQVQATYKELSAEETDHTREAFSASVLQLSEAVIVTSDAAYETGSLASLASFPNYFNERLAEEITIMHQNGMRSEAEARAHEVFASPQSWSEAVTAAYEDWRNDYPNMDPLIEQVTSDLALTQASREQAFSADESFYDSGREQIEEILTEDNEAALESRSQRRR